MAERFVIFPGDGRIDTNWGPKEFIPGSRLIELYGLNPAECLVLSEHRDPLDDEYDRELVPLFPLDDGRYKEHLEQMKIGDFQKYIRARKLHVYHSSGSSLRRGAMREKAAEQQARSIRWHEKHWPDFPEAYERMPK